LDPYPTGSPKRICALHRCARAISGVSFVCPTIRDHERKGTGTEWEGGGEESQRTSNVSKYALTSATNCSLRSLSNGKPHGWPSVWGKVRKTKVQLAGHTTDTSQKKRIEIKPTSTVKAHVVPNLFSTVAQALALESASVFTRAYQFLLWGASRSP